MSEASESYHLYRVGRARARNFMREIGMSGWIVADNECWTTVLPLEGDEDPAVLPVLGIWWHYHADSGLDVEVCRGGARLARISTSWGANTQLSAVQDLSELMGDFELGTRLGALVRKLKNSELAEGVQVRDNWAQELRLPAYKWLSSRYCREVPIEALRERFPGAEEVGVGAEL